MNYDLKSNFLFDLISSQHYQNVLRNIKLRNETLTDEEKETIKKKIDETSDLEKLKSFFEKYYPFIIGDDSDSSDLDTDSDSDSKDEPPPPPEE